ncbi:metallophosphoesterase [Amycolatopsis thermoflava]|uniref:metallophosphoesterase n=1 Tax=Amycolatopsis thermoflava TaxID=84480 RepID=UPI000407A290|nr:metallophosphoesterase [Amycolatopsis thermoflava]
MVAVIALVVAAFLAAVAAFHWWAWRRLVADALPHGSVRRRVATGTLVAGPLLMVAAPLTEFAGAPYWLVRVVSWPGFLWMAVCVYLLPALLAGEVVRPPLRRLLARRDTGPVPPQTAVTRRVFVSRVVGGATVAAVAGTVGYGVHSLFSGPRVLDVTVPLAKLPPGADGFRIAVVSDIHAGPLLGRGFTRHVVDTINATSPDLVAVVGDLVDGDVEDLAPAVAPLAGLRSRHGTFFVTGNHEYLSGAGQWVDHVRDLGMRLLANERVELPGFDLAGVNDVSADEGEGPDFAKALGGRDLARATLLLAHQPILVGEAAAHGVDLQLSGHTHGGQFWPGHLVVSGIQHTLAGLTRHGGTQLYVTRGAGAWGPPVRVGAPPDITVVRLASR